MHLPSANLPSKPGSRARKALAFTLTEMMVTMAVFLLVVIAMVSLQTFGVRMTSITASKLTSIGYSLTALDAIRDEVRGANSVFVGNGTGALFTATGTVGNTLEIFPTTNNSYIQVYLNTNSGSLYTLHGTNSGAFLIASGITNHVAFQSMNYAGNIATNSQDHYTITMTLKFCQLAYQVPGKTYDYYTMEATMTPRTQN